MGQFYSGQHGQLYIKPSTSGSQQKVGSLKNWSISFTQSTLETSCLEDTDRTILPGMRSFSGSSSLLYYQEASSNLRLMTQDFIYGKSRQSNPASKSFGQNATPNYSTMILRLFDGANRDFEYTCLMTNFTISCAVGEVVTAEFSFEGHGLPPVMSLIT